MAYPLSIVVPVFNSEKFIERSLQSCISQDYLGPIEIILVNDGSIDNSVDIIKKVIKNNTNTNRIFRLFNKENEGASAARNYGVKFASSKYIMFLDSDDFLEKEATSFALKILESESNIGLVYSDHRKVDSSGNKIMDRIKGDFSLNKLLTGMYIGHFRALSKKVFEKIGGFDISLTHSEDYDFVLKIATEGFDIKYINKILYNYVTNNNSLSLGKNGFEKIINGGQESLRRAFRRISYQGEIEFDEPYKGEDTVTRYLSPEKITKYLNEAKNNNF